MCEIAVPLLYPYSLLALTKFVHPSSRRDHNLALNTSLLSSGALTAIL